MYDRVKEAGGKDQGSPLLIGLHLFQEVLIDRCRECSVQTCLETFWRLSRDLDCHLQQAQRKLWVRLTGDPEPEIFMDLNCLGIEDLLHLSHKVETKVAVVEHDPLS